MAKDQQFYVIEPKIMSGDLLNQMLFTINRIPWATWQTKEVKMLLAHAAAQQLIIEALLGIEPMSMDIELLTKIAAEVGVEVEQMDDSQVVQILPNVPFQSTAEVTESPTSDD